MAVSTNIRASKQTDDVSHANICVNLQWYYFAVSNMRKSIAYTFHIINLLKDDSLYNRGMRPAMFSVRNHQVRLRPAAGGDKGHGRTSAKPFAG